MEHFFQIFSPLYSTVTSLEGIAALCGILSVWYSARRSIFVYPVGLVSVCLYVYICYMHGIYGDMWINVFYAGMSIYGWYRWGTGSFEEDRVVIQTLTKQEKIRFITLATIAWCVLYLWLSRTTDSTVPVLDSFTTGFSIIAMVLMAEKKIEHWVYWIAVDVISVPLYIYKGLYATALQFGIFTILAWYGYRSWSKRVEVLSGQTA